MGTKYTMSTVCYLEKDDKILFLKFDKKWGQVHCAPGGKINESESPLECIIREFYEETNLTLINPKLRGYSHWNWQDEKYGIIFFYTANEFSGKLKASDEGKLFWISKNEISKLTQFDMNSILNNFIFKENLFEGNFKLNEDDTVKEYKIIEI